MMTGLSTIIPIILYIFGIILLVVLIILGIRLLQILDKVERVVDNVEEKVNSLNSIFYVINKTTDSIDLISTKVITTVSDLVGKIFKRNKKEKDDYE